MKMSQTFLRAWLLGFTLLTVALPTVVTYRGLFQPNYEWGLFGVHGRGAVGSWWVIALAAGFGWLALTLNHRKPGKVAAALLAVWHGGLFLNVLAYAARHGARMTLRGDAIGISINLAWIGPLFTGGCFAASVFLLWRAWATPPEWPSPITGLAKGYVVAGLVLIAAIGTLFILGDGVKHTIYDRLAIGVVVVQCLAIGVGLQEQTKARWENARFHRRPDEFGANLAKDKDGRRDDFGE